MMLRLAELEIMLYHKTLVHEMFVRVVNMCLAALLPQPGMMEVE